MEEMFVNEKNNNIFIERARRERRNQRALALKIRRRVIFAVLLIALSVLITFIITSNLHANAASNRVKTFSSVEVKYGDTIWSIASEYITDEYASVSDLVKEIENTNHISDGNITAGNYIIVPYYVEVSAAE